MKRVIINLIIVSFLLLQFSCQEECTNPDGPFTLSIGAFTGTQPDIIRVQAWILNLEDTEHRQWVTLEQNPTSLSLWMGSIDLPAGRYQVEAHVYFSDSEHPDVKLALLSDRTISLFENTSLNFLDLTAEEIFRLHEFNYHTVLSGADVCQVNYRVYTSPELASSYVYIDRFFYDGDLMLAGYFDEVCMGDETCGTMPPTDDTGSYARVMQASVLLYPCLQAADYADMINGMLIVGGKLKTGEVVPDAYDFMSYEF